MAQVDLTVEICGMSGDGTIAAGGILNEAMSRAGLFVLAFDSYPAEIRGFGRCVTHSRVGDREMRALSDRTHVLISLDDKESQSRIPFLAREAVVFFDSKPPSYVEEGASIAAHVEPDARLFGMPFSELAAAASGSTRGRNLTALGGFAAVFGIPSRTFHEVIEKKFKAKGEKVLDANLKSFDAGHRFALERLKVEQIPPIPPLVKGGREDLPLVKGGREDLPLEKAGMGEPVYPPLEKGGREDFLEEAEEKILISGNEAVVRGALDAGLALYFGYPITPATPIMESLAKALPDRGGRVVQMEDEIASIGAVLGSFFAGKRAMTATSGPGFALMTELITHGVMSETPAVIINAQRGGPATGLPSKTEQSDLHAAVFGGPGDSARIVIAPTDVRECYDFTLMSFQLAERYQTPVIVLTDFFLNNRVEKVEIPGASEARRANWNLYPEESAKGRYERYSITESGISPRAIPGAEGFLFSATGLEHTEKGRPDYSSDIHSKMTEKRHRKIRGALKDLPEPVEWSSGGTMDVGVIAWGSTFGSALEAVLSGQKEGMQVGALKITSLFPYHAEAIRAFMKRCKEILIPELNYEGQLANLIGHLHAKDVVRLNRTTGMPMSPTLIYERIKSLI